MWRPLFFADGCFLQTTTLPLVQASALRNQALILFRPPPTRLAKGPVPVASKGLSWPSWRSPRDPLGEKNPVLPVLPVNAILPILPKKRKVPVIGLPIHAYDWYLSATRGSLPGAGSGFAHGISRLEYQQVCSL